MSKKATSKGKGREVPPTVRKIPGGGLGASNGRRLRSGTARLDAQFAAVAASDAESRDGASPAPANRRGGDARGRASRSSDDDASHGGGGGGDISWEDGDDDELDDDEEADDGGSGGLSEDDAGDGGGRRQPRRAGRDKGMEMAKVLAAGIVQGLGALKKPAVEDTAPTAEQAVAFRQACVNSTGGYGFKEVFILEGAVSVALPALTDGDLADCIPTTNAAKGRAEDARARKLEQALLTRLDENARGISAAHLGAECALMSSGVKPRVMFAALNSVALIVCDSEVTKRLSECLAAVASHADVDDLTAVPVRVWYAALTSDEVEVRAQHNADRQQARTNAPADGTDVRVWARHAADLAYRVRMLGARDMKRNMESVDERMLVADMVDMLSAEQRQLISDARSMGGLGDLASVAQLRAALQVVVGKPHAHTPRYKGGVAKRGPMVTMVERENGGFSEYSNTSPTKSEVQSMITAGLGEIATQMKRHSADANHLLVQALAAAEGNKRQAASCPVCTLPHHGACAFACSKCGRDTRGCGCASTGPGGACFEERTNGVCRRAVCNYKHMRAREPQGSGTPKGVSGCFAYARTGACRYGDSCRFAHGGQGRNQSPPQRIGGGQAAGACRLFASRQGCRFGDRCKFAHDAGRAGAYGAAKALEYKAPAQGSQNARGQDSADRAPGATHGVHPDRAAQVTQGIQQDRE